MFDGRSGSERFAGFQGDTNINRIAGDVDVHDIEVTGPRETGQSHLVSVDVDVRHVVVVSLADLFTNLQRESLEDAVGDVSPDRFHVLGTPGVLDFEESVFHTMSELVEVEVRVGPLQLGNVVQVSGTTGRVCGAVVSLFILVSQKAAHNTRRAHANNQDEKDNDDNGVCWTTSSTAITSSTAESATSPATESAPSAAAPSATAEPSSSAGPRPDIDGPHDVDGDCAGGDPPGGPLRA